MKGIQPNIVSTSRSILNSIKKKVSHVDLVEQNFWALRRFLSVMGISPSAGTCKGCHLWSAGGKNGKLV